REHCLDRAGEASHRSARRDPSTRLRPDPRGGQVSTGPGAPAVVSVRPAEPTLSQKGPFPDVLTQSRCPISLRRSAGRGGTPPPPPGRPGGRRDRRPGTPPRRLRPPPYPTAAPGSGDG